MTNENILNALAPCGLNCEKCFAYADGDIRKHSDINPRKNTPGSEDIKA